MREKQAAIGLAILLVVSVLAPFVGAVAAAPSGMVTVPDGQITEDVPDGESIPISAQQLRGNVLADDHADTLEVIVTTPERADEKYLNDDANVIGGGEVAIVLRDTESHDGRDVAIDAGLLREALGSTPEMIYGTHSSGETWTSDATYVDGYLRFHVEKFSSNTVTFSGEVRTTGTFSDGSSVSYQLDDLDSASNVTVNLTGKTTSAWDNVTKTKVSSGTTVNLNIAGNAPPTGPSGSPRLTLTGRQRKFDMKYDGGLESSYGEVLYGDQGDGGKVRSAMQFSPNKDLTIKEVAWDEGGDTGKYSTTVEIYIDAGSQDSDWTSGTKVGSFDPTAGGSPVSLDSYYSVSQGNTYHITFVTTSTDGDGSQSDWTKVKTYDSGGGMTFINYDGVSETLSKSPQMVLRGDSTQDPSVDIDGDGTDEVQYGGTLGPGETYTESVTLAVGADAEITTTTGGVGVDVDLKERTQTKDPTLQLNSNSTSYSGELSDGETVTRTIDKSALKEGENTVNVSLLDQSADAPTMQVEAEIVHDATSKQDVTYDAEKYSERYNISKTFASDREFAQATIPFEGTVTSIREVRVRENGGSWTTADAWSLDETTLTVETGSVDAGDTVTIRTTGSKVVPNNGDIQVTDPVVLGQSGDPKVEITDRSSGEFELLYSGTPQKERVHYAYNETWTDTSEFSDFRGEEQQFVVPNVEAGDQMRIGTIPVDVQPVSDSGDVEVIVTDPAQSDPQYEVRPGSESGDEIRYTYLNAKDDSQYELFSKTQGIVLDTGTANSPLTLTGTDDAGAVEWLLNTDSEGSTGGDEDISVIGPVGNTSSGLLNGLPLGAIVAVLGVGALGVFGAAYWRGGRDGVTAVASTATSAGGSVASLLVSVVGWLRRHRYVSALLGGIISVALVATGAIPVPEGTVPAVFTVGVPIGAYLGLSALDRFSWPIWGVVTAISLIVGLVWFGVDLTGAFLNQQVTIILAVGGMYLLYQLIQAYQSPDSVRNFVFRGSSSSETTTQTTDSNRGD